VNKIFIHAGNRYLARYESWMNRPDLAIVILASYFGLQYF